MSQLLSVAAASLLGSLHCAGMCGGLIGFYSAQAPASAGAASRPWAAHAAYHLTRGAAYTALGALAGQLGAGLDQAAASAGLGRLGALLAGAVLIAWGVLSWPRGEGRKPLRLGLGPATPGRWQRLEARFVQLARGAQNRPPLARAALLGLSAALLPCGWLYAFVVLAAGSGSAANGALLLLAFWSGTVPLLLALGVGIQRWTARLRAQLPRLSALLLLLLGAYQVGSRWPGESAAQTPAPSCHHAQR
jgi:sulfite exporter TauE/SafE